MTPPAAPPPSGDAVLLAAGRSQRMDGVDKLWHPLTGPDGRSRPLIAFPLAAFQACAAVRRIVLVVRPETAADAEALVGGEGCDKVVAVVPGGERRRDSVLAGLRALPDCEWVAVHDAARPLVTPELIEAGFAEARPSGAACCAVPIADTVKESDGVGFVRRTLDRARLYLAQTPQVFRYDLLLDAHQNVAGDATDDAALVEALGVDVNLYKGSPRNLKVTTPDDLALVQAMLTANA